MGSPNRTLLAGLDHLSCAGHVGTTLPLPPFAETHLQLSSRGQTPPRTHPQVSDSSKDKVEQRLHNADHRALSRLLFVRLPVADGSPPFYVWCTRPAGDEAERIFPGCKVASTKMERRKGPLQVRPDATLSERAFWPRYGRCWIWVSRRNSSFIPPKALLLA